MSAYFKVYSTIAKGVKKLKGNKSKVSPTIKSVKPASGSLTKRRKDTEEIMKIRTRHGAAPSKRTSDTIKKISKLNDDLDKTRARKMGGGMMGRRMGYSQGSSKGKVPTTPKEKSLAKLAPPKDKITFGDVVAGRTKGKRMQAKDGTDPFNTQKNIIAKQGKRGNIVATGTMDASLKVKTKKRKNERRR